jgi:hypothetical protein
MPVSAPSGGSEDAGKGKAGKSDIKSHLREFIEATPEEHVT